MGNGTLVRPVVFNQESQEVLLIMVYHLGCAPKLLIDVSNSN
jgi:hypothetical protein